MKVVLAPDSFKGSLSAQEVCEAMEQGVTAAAPEAETILIPMADGGEGSIDALTKWVHKEVPIAVHGPDGSLVDTSYVILSHEGKEVAFVECARSTGLDLIPDEGRDPLLYNSFGLGEQIRSAVEKGYRDIVVSLGGSATTDGGTGLLQALGYKLYNADDKELEWDRNILLEADKIEDTDLAEKLSNCQITIASDVTNPFHGTNGAAYIYGPQKGASNEQVQLLDEGLVRFSKAIEKFNGRNVQEIEGAGAAGGLGGALTGVLNAKMQSGFDVIAELVELEKFIDDSDLVFTGEGSLDAQSANGKVPVSIGLLAEKYKKPVFALAGKVDLNGDYKMLTAVFSIQSEPLDLKKALEPSHSKKALTHTSEQVLRTFLSR
ncbi:glycerate kinase [Halobacillus salinarum]|uniref:Glycerate kinase n=1 Tax=Halobacillus salinarum TaxID=2932257 RepID=A0ABY4EM24_9BACI|nr:glycerate kinase [Halobacillus salinarum]UOQ45057.1 glycerate kinase [Halobacillus salinarum]